MTLLKVATYKINRGREALHQTATMDEMDLPQMKKEVESLKYQLAFKREKSSKTVTEFSLSFGKVDRRRRPRGSLFEPGADEEQPMGGERKMHPSLEETTRPVMSYQLQPR
ncbi:hypothetical protein INR49_032318 [Caranx melampygus]|nr:hypothetical protein INR49_032318 [Caranx melampygus]